MSKPVFLDVDSSIVERNLKLTNDEDKSELGEFEKIFNVPEEEYPSKLVKPEPGFCVKTKEIFTETKVFFNVCKTDAIPPPAQTLTEHELSELLEDRRGTEYKVPMSIGDLRTEKDNKGEDAKVCDVAINDKFFVTIENSQFFKDFVMAIVSEAMSNKHKIFVTNERTLMKNRKFFGTLQVHRIQDRTAKSSEISYKKPTIEVISSSGPLSKEVPKCKLFRMNRNSDTFYAEVHMPKINSCKEITLDVGEDRIIVESKVKKYLLDIFIPFDVYPDTVQSCFNTHTRILTILMFIQSNK